MVGRSTNRLEPIRVWDGGPPIGAAFLRVAHVPKALFYSHHGLELKGVRDWDGIAIAYVD